MANQKKNTSFAKQMMVSLACGLVAGIAMLLLRENLVASGKAEVWATINNLLFQDITAAGAESAIGLFYVLGQLFIRALQLVIVPMVFTSITLAIGRVTDTKKLGRLSAKTFGSFIVCNFFALLSASIIGYAAYNAGLFSAEITDLAGGTGKTGSNPLNVILNVIPTNIFSTFSNNSSVLAIVFLAVALGLTMNALGEEKTATLKKFITELNDVVAFFLSFVITKFSPIGVFMLLTRTFASYGINHLKPALVYVVITMTWLLVFMVVAFSLFIAITAKVSPIPFIKKMTKVAIFGFSTSSSAATLPLNLKTAQEDLGIDEQIASFVLPLGMAISMNGTAIMQVIATLFVAGVAGIEVSVGQLVVIAVLAWIASSATPAAPGAGAIVLFTILSGVGFVSEPAMIAYSLILAINRPVEMLVTAVNVVDDTAAAVYVAKSEGLLDEKQYNA